ncbi:metal-dependent hydrolase, partial [Thermodesulfobacteriota bacterium]
MSPVTHLLISWSIANTTPLNRRERALVTLSGVVPDIDGLGLIADVIPGISGKPLELWDRWHHVLGHNIGFGLLCALCALLFSRRRFSTCLLSLVAFHTHVLCDLVGARGPDGYQWPIPYLLPFSDAWHLQW